MFQNGASNEQINLFVEIDKEREDTYEERKGRLKDAKSNLMSHTKLHLLAQVAAYET